MSQAVTDSPVRKHRTLWQSGSAAQGRVQPAAPRAVIPVSRTQRRWQVLYQQLQCDHEPCFQTEKRHSCQETTCPWRTECLALRAEWRR